METRLALFVALVFVVLVWNTALLWFVYRAAARAVDRAARYQHYSSQVIEGLRGTLEKAEVASDRATEWSGQLRERVAEASGNVDRVENLLGYGLAKIDFNVDRVSKEINDGANRIKAAVSEPLFRTGTVVHGIKALLELLALGRKDHPRS